MAWKPLALASALLLRTLAATAQTAAPAEALAQAEQSAVDAITRDGFAAGFPALLAAQGVLLWPGAPVVAGPDSVRRLLQAQRGLDSLRISWQPLGIRVAEDGTLGVTWGVAIAVPPGRTPRIGRYIAAWQRDGAAWKLAAFVPLGLFPAAATTLPADLAAIRSTPLAAAGRAAGFITADLDFARLAGDSTAALAFERYAAPDAVTLGAGLLNQGPAAIGRALSGGPPSHWAWHPVRAGASAGGDLGFTVGESLVRPEGGTPSYGKYLTIWRRLPNGTIRFLTDGGNARPPTP
jgi:hypothetical protein